MSDTAKERLERGYAARRDGRGEDARSEFAEAVRWSRERGARCDLIGALKGLGQVARDAGDLEAALSHYREATELCREEGDPLLLAHTVRHVGDIHLEARRLAEAEACYDEALSLYRGDNGTGRLDLANAIRSRAILQEEAGEGGEARRLWSEARQLYAAVNVREGVEESAAHLARLDAAAP